jgi:hypothetical protein
MASSRKDKATVCFIRFSDGKVVGEIIDDERNVVESKSFGVMSIEEYERLMDFLNREDPKLAGKILPTIELTGN